MWVYEKKLMFPVDITTKDVEMAKTIIAQYGGPDGELSASLQYLNQRFNMPTGKSMALLTDIGTEELAHLEIVGTMVHQLLYGATVEELKAAGLDPNYVLHGNGIFYNAPTGPNWTSDYLKSNGDALTDLTSNIAAEQRARITYDYLLSLTNNPQLQKPLIFLREREVVHLQRFGECLDDVREYMNHNKYFYKK